MESSTSVHYVCRRREKKTTPTIGFRMMDVEGGSRVFFSLDPEFLLSLLIRCCLLQASNKLLDQLKKLSTYLIGC
jgi:hypothetical protein